MRSSFCFRIFSCSCFCFFCSSDSSVSIFYCCLLQYYLSSCFSRSRCFIRSCICLSSTSLCCMRF